FLLAGLGVAALADPRRARYFRSAAPWVTIAVGAILFAPHVAWIVAHDFAPFTYAVVAHQSTLASSAWSGVGFLLGFAAYAAPAALLALLMTRPSVAAIGDTVWPRTPERRLVLLSFVAPLVLPALAAARLKVYIVSLWAMSAVTLLPIVLLSSPLVTIPRRATVWLLLAAIVFPVVMVLASPFIAIWIHREGVPNYATHYRLLAQAVDKAWHQTTSAPLRYLGSYTNIVNGVSFYLSDRLSTLDIGDPASTPWSDAASVARAGVALVCPEPEAICMHFLNQRAGDLPRHAVTLSRKHWGVGDKPVRYAIVVVPPAKKSRPAEDSRDQRADIAQQPALACDGALEIGGRSFELSDLRVFLRRIEKRMVDRIARDLVQLAIAERIVARGADVFVGQVDARHAHVVGREHDRHARRPVGHQRMILAAHAEDHIVAGEVDLDCGGLPPHLVEQLVAAPLVGERDTVPDAPRARDFDRLADVEGQILRRHKTEPQLTRVQRDRHVLRQEADHLHVARIVLTRDAIVLRTDEVQSGDAPVGADQRRGERSLHEDIGFVRIAVDLRDVFVADATAGLRALRVALENLVDALHPAVDRLARLGHGRWQVAGLQPLEPLVVAAGAGDRCEQLRAIVVRQQRDHQLGVLHGIGRVVPQHRGGHLGRDQPGDA